MTIDVRDKLQPEYELADLFVLWRDDAEADTVKMTKDQQERLYRLLQRQLPPPSDVPPVGKFKWRGLRVEVA